MRKVQKREYNRWIKWLRNQGYSGPFAGLKTSHECVKLLAKELRKDPPTILETRPRDHRTIVSAFNRYGRKKRQQPDRETSGSSLGPKETKAGQDELMLRLPPWVSQAQQQHIEGEERQDELGIRIGEITRCVAGIRQKLESFRDCFADIDPVHERFWIPLDKETMTQLHGHLPNEAFWEKVEGSEGFIEKAKKCRALMDAARESFTLAGEELAPLQSPSEPLPHKYITLGWARRVLGRTLDPQLGFQVPGKYYYHDLPDGRVMLYDMESLYIGRAHKKAEKRHRELVECFAQSKQFEEILTLMKQLRELRQQILARIDECLRKGEYVLNYCPDCPAEQARKLLVSEGSN